MRLGLNILATFLHSLKPRKLLSSSRNTYLPNIFARHNPRLAARAARLRAAKSASRIRTSAAPSFTSSADGTAPRNGAHHQQQHRRRSRCSRPMRSLKRSTHTAAAIILPAQVPSYPQPPGAYACGAPPGGPSISATTTDDFHTSTNTSTIDHDHGADPSPLVAQKVFFEALYKQRAVLLRASDERREAAEAEARRVRAEEDAEYLRLLAEDQRKAQEEQRRAEEEEAAARREEARRVEVLERCRRRREERRRRHAAREERRERARREEERRERERLEEERRERERLEEGRRERERLEQVRRLREQEARRQKAAAEAAARAERVAEWHRYYEEKWAVLRADVEVSSLAFSDIPWPVFGIPKSAEDITAVRVQEFLFHPQRESVQSAGQAKSLRSEMLRWHPDKFDAKVLNNVMEDDREVVKEAAGEVARILIQLTMEMQR